MHSLLFVIICFCERIVWQPVDIAYKYYLFLIDFRKSPIYFIDFQLNITGGYPMKKIFGAVMALCLLFTMFFACGQTALAASKPKISNVKETGSAVIKQQSISISYKVNQKCTATVRVYDKNNKLVIKLKNITVQKNKTTSFKWNGKNSKGNYVSAGTYKIKLYAGKTTITKSAKFVKAGVPAPGSTVNLVFIHHSVGAGWLADGLNDALNKNNYHLADIYYGWKTYGDNTNTTDWPTWFTDKVMDLVYDEKGTMTGHNSISAAPGENTVIMFKSCFPNSDVGESNTDEKDIYKSLIPYFEKHPDKMFILVTPPPMRYIPTPKLTRSLCNWLTDRKTGWLANLKTSNVFVFDLYNVLTDKNAHHRYINGAESHVVVSGEDLLYYPNGEDDHPNTAGNQKAAEEFIGLLNYWYKSFASSR